MNYAVATLYNITFTNILITFQGQVSLSSETLYNSLWNLKQKIIEDSCQSACFLLCFIITIIILDITMIKKRLISHIRCPQKGKVHFSEHAQRICFIFLTNQICQTWLWACTEWWDVCRSQTSCGRLFQRSQFLLLTKKIASGDENCG